MLIQRPDRVQHAFGVPCLDLGLGTGLADALDGAEQHVVRDARGALARLSVSSRSTSASPSGQEDRLAIHSCNTVLRRNIFRGCNHSLMFRLLYLLGLLTVQTEYTSAIRPQGRIHRAEPMALPPIGSGIATCPNPDN